MEHFFKIMIPNALPGIISGGVLAFARGLGEFGATAMIAGNIPGKTRTLPLAVYSETAAGNMDEAYQYVMVIVAICFVMVVGMNIYLVWEKKNRAKDRRDRMELEIRIRKNLKEFTLKADFVIHDGCTGLMGPSGSGKSMTLKCIAGIETPDEGRILLDGKSLFDSGKNQSAAPEEEDWLSVSRVRLVSQYDGGRKCTVRPEGKKMPKGQIKECVEKMLERFQIRELAKRYPRQLSGGQKQRTAIARLMAYEPEVILLDEPLSALDEELREELQQELSQMLADFQKPSVLVSHDAEEVRRLCQKQYTIREGRIQPYADFLQKKGRL